MKKLKLFFAACALLAGGNIAAAQSFTDGGKYYLQNVETGLYWGAGDHTNWGTRAMLVDNPEYVTLHAGDGTYTIESQVSNGGTAYYFNGDYMDNGSPVSLTIIASGDYYTIANGSTYYGSGSSKAIYDNSGLTAESAGALWKIISEEDMLASLSNATVDVPVDATFLFLDPGFGRNNRNYSNWTIGNNCTNLNIGRQGTDKNNCYGCGESYHSTFSLTQTQTVPSGVYKVTGRAFYRQDGSDNDNLPTITVGTESRTFPLLTGGENSMLAAQNAFIAGSYAFEPMYVQVTDGSLTVAYNCDQNSLWCIWDGIELVYYGDVSLAEVVLADYVKAYKEALAAAKAYQDTNMFDEDKSDLNTAISENTLDLSGSVTEEDLTTAANNLNAAAQAAAIAATKYNTYTTAVTTIGESTNVDLSTLIVNNGFESGNVTGWTNSGVQYAGAQGNKAFDNTQGNYYAERWHAAGTVDLNQTVEVLPAGLYEVSAYLYTDTSDGVLYANDMQTSFSTSGLYTVQVAIDDKGSIKLGAGCTLTGSTWICMDEFKLKYVSALPDVTAVEGNMNSTVADAQTAAIAAYNESKTAANYNAAAAAIAAAQASKDAYTAAAAALTLANTNLNSTNVYTAAAYTTFSEAIANAQSTYNDNSMTTADAAALNVKLNRAGWGTTPAPLAADYVGSAWTGTNIANNFWSDEGDAEGSSDMTVPFVQYWTEDANKLAANTITGAMTGLDNGLYSVTALVRVVNKKTEEGSTGYDGISLQVNDGTAVAFADATEYTDGYAKEITAEGLVKDGNLNIMFIVGETNASWLAFKNVKYTKVRDLTDEEQATAPTAIALYNGENEVTEPIALNATVNSVTLTTKLTPDNASEGYIEWSTSDTNVATVADGVVTGVAPGTATITATSTLDNTVKATATVTVTYPETAYEANSIVNDGPARSIVNLGENLIKNGTFEYPNAFTGWTDGQNPAKELTSANFDVVTDGDSKYIRSKNHNGAGGAGSIGTAWEIEAGKTYIFGYKAKAVSAGTTEYHVVSLTNTLTIETSKISTTQTVGTDWTEISYKFTNTEGYKYLQFRARWLGEKGQLSSFDDFYLTEVLSETTVGNVDYATAAIPTANIGTGAFQYSQDAINAVNDLVQGTATVAEVEAAYEAVTTLNAPATDQVFNIVMGELTWTNNNNATMLSTAGKAVTYYVGGRSDAGGYTAQFDKEPNTNLAQAFYFTAAEGKNKYTIHQIDAEGSKRYLCTGTVYGGNANQVRTTTETASAEVYTITATSAEGVYNITNASNINLGAQDAGLYGTTRNNNLKLVETSKPSIAINTTAAGYGTVILPFAVTSLSTDVKAYTCAAVDGSTLTLVEVDALEANKPYIIEGAWEATVTGDAQGTALSYTEGLLTGVYTEGTVEAGKYVMQNNNDKVAFYLVAEGEGKQPTIKANRCYLTAPTAESTARAAYFFPDNTTTAISAIDALASGNAQIFSADGKQLTRLQKGMNIIRTADGRTQKVMVK